MAGATLSIGMLTTSAWAVGAATPASAALPKGCVKSGTTITCTYKDSKHVLHWKVPTGVTSAKFDVRGGHGAFGLQSEGGAYHPGGAGGSGGQVIGTLKLKPGTVLDLYVGSATQNSGVNGGRSGGITTGGAGSVVGGTSVGGAGGGGSFVMKKGKSPTGRANPLIAAGGGGGGSVSAEGSGGNGGGKTGTKGAGTGGGAGGTKSAGSHTGKAKGGKGNAAGGGGGGGGWYGGKGGAGAAAGGGGGSGRLPRGASSSTHSAPDGSIIITYTKPAPTR
jgi:hypothetical protein